MRGRRPCNSPFLALIWTVLATVVIAQEEESCSNSTTILPSGTATSLAIPTCTTFTGRIELPDWPGSNSSDLEERELNFDGYETINGNLVVYQNGDDKDTTIRSETLRDLNGTLHFTSGPNITEASSRSSGDVTLSFPVLEHMTRLHIEGGFDRLTLSFGPNTTLNRISIEDIDSDWPRPLYLNVTVLNQIFNNRDFLDSGEYLSYIRNNNMGFFHSTLVHINHTLSIFENSFTSIEFPQMENARKLNIRENDDLETIVVAARSVSALYFHKNGRKTRAELSRLTNITGKGINMYGEASTSNEETRFANLADIQLPVLREVSRTVPSIQFDDNIFVELHLPQLEMANTTLEITSNGALSDVIMPRLGMVRTLTVRDNPWLLNFTANGLKKANNINLVGNFTNVELFSLEEVTGNFTLIGAPNMDCSWFDDNLFQKVIKGSYRCDGNHTRPDVPRTPSTWPSGEDSSEDKDEKAGEEEEEEQSADNGGGLSTGAKAGIGAGVGVVGLVAVVGGLFLLWKSQKKKAAEGNDGGVPGTDRKVNVEADSKAWEGAEMDSHTRAQVGTAGQLPYTQLPYTPAGVLRVVELPSHY